MSANGRPTTASISRVVTTSLRFETPDYSAVLAWAMQEKLTCTVLVDLRSGNVGTVRLEERHSDTAPHLVDQNSS